MTIEEFKNKLEQDKALKAEMLEAIKTGKEKEFLAAQGVEVPEKRELSEEELAGVAGGKETSIYKTDSRGNPTHYLIKYSDGTQEILYLTCPKCGGLLHKGYMGAFYCDPCNNWYICDWSGGPVEHTIPV